MAPITLHDTHGTNQNPLQKTSMWENRKSVLLCFLITSGMFQFGFDYAMIGGFQARVGFLEVYGYQDPASSIGWSINPTVQSIIGSFMLLGGALGAMISGPMGTIFSRRWALVVSAARCIVATIIMMATENFGALYFARIMGCGTPVFQPFAQLYVAEIAPAQLRGVMFGFISWWQSFGVLIGSIMTNSTSTIPGKNCYIIPLGLLLIIPSLMIIILPLFPESPRCISPFWHELIAGLRMKGREQQAERALRRIRGARVEESAIRKEIDDINEANALEKAMKNGIALFDLFCGVNRRRTLLCIACGLFQTATGSTFLVNYSSYFFLIAGESKPFVDSIITTVAGLLGCMVSFFLVRILTRRAILMGGSFLQSMCMFVVGLVYTVWPNSPSAGKCLVAFVFIYSFVLAGTITPYAFVVRTEIPNQRLRAYTIAVLFTASYAATWVVSFTLPYYINPAKLDWGAKYAWLWFPANLFMGIFVFFFIPETKDRTLEEIDEMFEMKVAARKFSSYTCVGIQQAVEGGPVDKLGVEVQNMELNEMPDTEHT